MPRPLNLSQKSKPLWQGPQIDGITYSMLCRFLQCRERFRLYVIEGLTEPSGWNYHMQYGNLWHECEEAHAGCKEWKEALWRYFNRLASEYPADRDDIVKWTTLCEMQFPLYIRYWANDWSQKERKPVAEELTFRTPYTLPSGDIIYLRGKFDCIFKKAGQIWLQENKTKGDIDAEGLAKTITQLLQTTLYQTALRTDPDLRVKLAFSANKFAGTLYNVIRRPLSDRNAPRQRKGEKLPAFVRRVGEYISRSPQSHFYRWPTVIRDADLKRMQRECLDPILQQLLDWWKDISTLSDPFQSKHHYRFPFGVYHSMERGFRGAYFELLATGNRVGLEKVKTLFRELDIP